jgi:drug/metabolite transporter (DMT)-like permease
MKDRSRESLRPLLVLTAGAVCISFAAVFVKWLGADRLGPTAIGFWRAFFGAIILFVIALLRGQKLPLVASIQGFALLAGFIFCLDLFFWHRSIIYSGAGMATILANTQVFATALLGFIVFRERITLRFVVAALSAMIGVILLVGLVTESVSFSGSYARGVVFGLLTGIVYANYIITVKRAGQRPEFPDFVTFMAWTSLYTALFLGIIVSIEGNSILPPDLETVVILALLALVAQALGWWAISSSLKKIEASRAGLILLLQPTLAMIWGALFFSEQLAVMQIVGAAITLAAIYLGSLQTYRRRKLD